MTDEFRSHHQARLAHIMAAVQNKNFNPTDSENVIVIGKTGSGKTSIISLLLGRDAGVGHGIFSKTTDTEEYDMPLPVEYGDRKIKLIDTRGILDTKLSDDTVLESLMHRLTGRFYHVNTIMLVIECARFTQETQSALESLIRAFGLDDIERSKRLLVVVTKVENLPIVEKEEILRQIIEHPFFTKLGISVDYLQRNTIDVFAGISIGVQPRLVLINEDMRAESKANLLGALARKNKAMTVSNDFGQKVVNMLTSNMPAVKTVSQVAFAIAL